MFLERFQLVTGRTWRGTAFGGVKGRTEMPSLVAGKNMIDTVLAERNTYSPFVACIIQIISQARSRLMNMSLTIVRFLRSTTVSTTCMLVIKSP
jgi:hypothetical protein